MNPDLIVVVSASIGVGHDGAARELGGRLTADGFTVTHHDIVDLLTPGLGTVLRGTRPCSPPACQWSATAACPGTARRTPRNSAGPGLSAWSVSTGQLSQARWHPLHGDLRDQQQAADARLAEARDAAILIASLARQQSAAAVRKGVGGLGSRRT